MINTTVGVDHSAVQLRHLRTIGQVKLLETLTSGDVNVETTLRVH